MLKQTIQSLRAYYELLGNKDINLSHKKLREIIKTLLKRAEEMEKGNEDNKVSTEQCSSDSQSDGSSLPCASCHCGINPL